MEVPIGFVAKLWSFVSFLPFFVLLFILGVLKERDKWQRVLFTHYQLVLSWMLSPSILSASLIFFAYNSAVIGPLVAVIIGIGNSAVILGLWTAHFVWTCYCVAKTKKIGLVLKILVLLSLPVPLVLWPIIGIVGSVLGGIGYGLLAPLIATFEAVGENITGKFYHCFIDGCWSTLEGSCTVVRDFTDFCFHSYFSYMDELSEQPPANEKPVDIKLLKVPSCLLASLIAVPVDMLFITAIALWKSPYMLFKGWKRLFEDMVGREGPFLESVCVPFAVLSIILWPLAVVGAAIAAIISSLFLGLYAGVIVHQEESLQMGLAYIVSVISLFDEYTNDLLYLREGSCLPRPKYCRNMSPPSNSLERRKSTESDRNDPRKGSEGSYNTRLVSQRSRTFKGAIQQYKSIQVWEWLFKSCEVNGRILFRDGLIDVNDVEECISKGNCKKLGIQLPAWSILQCLLVSAKSSTSGLVISDEVELTRSNSPRGKLFEWYIGPLFIMKDQIKGFHLEQNEESSLRTLIMRCKNKEPQDWDDTGFPSSDNVRRAQLQALIRRLQGIVASMSRMPTFRRRFKNLVKVLYVEAIQVTALENHIGGGILQPQYRGKSSKDGKDGTREEVANAAYDDDNIV